MVPSNLHFSRFGHFGHFFEKVRFPGNRGIDHTPCEHVGGTVLGDHGKVYFLRIRRIHWFWKLVHLHEKRCEVFDEHGGLYNE